MEIYARWNSAKNKVLSARHGVGFEDIIAAIANGQLLADLPHPNAERYPGQRILVVQVGAYPYVVPYVPEDGSVFFKTLYPSRKYLGYLSNG